MLPPTFAEWAASGAWLAPEMRVLPLAPGLLGNVLSLAAEPDVDGRKLTRIVSRDPVLTARVLRMANVAASAPMTEVTSIDQSVIRLGTSAVRRAVLSVCFASWAQPADGGGAGRAQIAHAIGTACLARVVALRTGGDADESFVHGLLHDIGKLFLLKLHTEWTKRGGAHTPDDTVAQVVAEQHAQIGGMSMQHWGLPVVLREPVRWHHDPTSAPHHARAAGVTYVANRLAHRYGFGCEPEIDDALGSDPVLQSFGAGPAWVAEMDLQAPVIAEAAQKYAH